MTTIESIRYDGRGRTQCEFHRIPGIGNCKVAPEFIFSYRRSAHPGESVTEKVLCREHTREMIEVAFNLMARPEREVE